MIPGPFLLVQDTMINDSANVSCFIAGVCGLPQSSHSEQVSHSDTCLCLRGSDKCVGPLSLVTTAFEQTVQRTVVCLRSTKPSYQRDSAVLGTNSWRAACCCVCFSVESQCGGGAHYELREPMRSGGGAS